MSKSLFSAPKYSTYINSFKNLVGALLAKYESGHMNRQEASVVERRHVGMVDAAVGSRQRIRQVAEPCSWAVGNRTSISGLIDLGDSDIQTSRYTDRNVVVVLPSTTISDKSRCGSWLSHLGIPRVETSGLAHAVDTDLLEVVLAQHPNET